RCRAARAATRACGSGRARRRLWTRSRHVAARAKPGRGAEFGKAAALDTAGRCLRTSSAKMNSPIYIVDAARTPFLKSRNRPGPFAASDLATDAGRALLLRQPFMPTDVGEVILGCAAPSVDEVNIGRVAALRMGCGNKVQAWTVMRNCASGMQALDSAIDSMR